MTEENTIVEPEIAPVTVDPAPLDNDAPSGPVKSEDELLGEVFDRVSADGEVKDADDSKGDKPRDATGKFVSPNAEREKAADGDGAGADETQTVAAAPAPAHLPAAIKADWDKIPEPARNAIVAHQTEMDRRFGEQGRQLETLKPLNEGLQGVIQQWPEYFQNATPAQIAKGASELAVIQSRLERGDLNTKLQTYLAIGKQYGLLSHASQILAGQQLPDSANAENALRNEIASLKQQIAQFGDPRAIEARIEQTLALKQQEAQDMALVAELSAGKDFFAEVQGDLPFYITKAKSKLGETAPHKQVFDLAYEMAVNADPELRAKAAAPGKTAAGVDPKRAEAAKRASAINVTSSTHGKDRPLTEDEALARAYDRATAA